MDSKNEIVATGATMTTKHEIEILECKTDQQLLACKNMKEYGNSFDYERYRCDVCGKRMKLHYEEIL